MPEPGRLADDIDRAANSVGGYVEIRMEPPMPDTPTLRDAAEAHFDAYMAWVEGGLRNDDEALRPLCDTADTLRAALSADAAGRARAEAAIARCEAEDAWAAFFEPGKMGGFDEQMTLAMERAAARLALAEQVPA